MQNKSALHIQFNIILALIIKELKVRFGTKKLGYIWLVIEPFLFILPFFVIRKVTGPWDNFDLILFLLTGIITVLFFTRTTQKLKNAVNANKALFAYRQVKIFDVVLSRLIIESFVSLSIFVASIAFFTLIFSDSIKFRIFPMAILTLILYLMLTLSWGILFLILTKRLPFLDSLIAPLNRFIFFTSGGFFSVSDIPYKYQDLLLLNPILNVVEILRYNIISQNSILYGDIYYVIKWSLASFFAAMIFYYINKRRLI